MVHVGKDGEYRFDPGKIREAHAWCQETCNTWLKQGKSVVVSNTFTQLWEMAPYIDMASELGITARVMHMTGNFGSIHNVPKDVVDRMKERWEPYPGEDVYSFADS